MKKVTFEEMLESMSARLHLIEAENESLKMDARSLEQSQIERCWKTQYPATPSPTLRNLGQGNQSCCLCGFVSQLTDLDWNDSALRAQFYFGLSYEIKDALVHFDTPSTLSLAIQQAIKVDNRLYERRLERTEDFQHSWNNPRRPPPPSPMVVPPPRSSNDMDIDFARRGPLTSEERQQRMSRGLCLVCGQSGHLKANCPKSNPNFRAPKSIRAIQIDDVDFESPGNDPGCL
ncbi:hypothetical protein BASA81_017399 [Batrachochytrium salamandrivorans]|nr:hypothetical protein BASA81_017399 [Batrachochytrium salamandrivorans]